MAVGRESPWLRPAVGAIAAAGLGLLAGSCSLSLPLDGIADPAPTGSVKTPALVLSRALDKEDLRRSNAALAVALDPQGNGREVAWDNPQSGIKGSVAALAPPFPSRDHICRAFKARVIVSPRDDHRLTGSACRNSDGDWVLAEIAPSERGSGTD